MRSVLLATSLLLVGIPSSAIAQSDNSTPPLQVAERFLQLSTPDGTNTYYACIDTGMHPGQGVVGPGYDAATYNVGVILQRPVSERPVLDPSTATPNLEGISCRLMYQGTDYFDVTTGKTFPPLP